jgi:DNA-binding protein YbaB
MSNDELRHDFDEVLSLVQDQMRDLTSMQRRRTALAAKATAGQGTVQVTVDAQRIVTEVVIADTYLEDYDFTDLADFIVVAAQAAAHEIDRQAAELLAPLTARRGEISAMSYLASGGPDVQKMMSALTSFVPENPTPPTDGDDDDNHDDDHTLYPTLRSS